MIPIKSGDIVIRDDLKYYVKSVSFNGAPLVTLLPLLDDEYITSVDEVTLLDVNEAVRRTKSMQSNDVYKVDLPDGVSIDEANTVLREWARRKK